MVSRRVQNVQLVYIPADAVKLSMKVLNGRCVLVVKTLVEKPRNYSCLSNFGRSQNHHPVAVFAGDVELVIRGCHFLNHDCGQGRTSEVRSESEDCWSKLSSSQKHNVEPSSRIAALFILKRQPLLLSASFVTHLRSGRSAVGRVQFCVSLSLSGCSLTESSRGLVGLFSCNLSMFCFGDTQQLWPYIFCSHLKTCIDQLSSIKRVICLNALYDNLTI